MNLKAAYQKYTLEFKMHLYFFGPVYTGSIIKNVRKLKPVIKLSCEVAKLFFEKELIWPFKALCTPTQLPAKTANVIAKIENIRPTISFIIHGEEKGYGRVS